MLLTLFALWRYGDSLSAGETDFFLRFLLASQSAIMWMSALFVMATLVYFAAMHACTWPKGMFHRLDGHPNSTGYAAISACVATALDLQYQPDQLSFSSIAADGKDHGVHTVNPK